MSRGESSHPLKPRYEVAWFLSEWQTERVRTGRAANQVPSPVTTAPNVTAFSAKLAVFACPSTSNYNASVPDILEWNNGAIPVRKVGIAARSDYEVVGGVQVRRQTASSADLSIIQFGPWGEPTYAVASGVSLRYPGSTHEGRWSASPA